MPKSPVFFDELHDLIGLVPLADDFLMRDFLEAPGLQLARAEPEHGARLMMLLVAKRLLDAEPMRHLGRLDHEQKRQAAARPLARRAA